MSSSIDSSGEEGDGLQKRLDTAMAELQQTPFGRKLLELWEKRPKPGDDFVAYRYDQDQELIAFAKEALDAAGDGQVWDLFQSMVDAFRKFEIEVLKVYKKMHLEKLGSEREDGRSSKAMLDWIGSTLGHSPYSQFHLFQINTYQMIKNREGFVHGLPSDEQLRVVRVASNIHRAVQQIQKPSGFDLYDEFA